MKREIPQLIAFTAGLAMILAFFIPTQFFRELQNTLSNWSAIVQAFAVFLALSSLTAIHGERISRKSEGSEYSVVLLLSLGITVACGMLYGVEDYYPDVVVVASQEDQTRLIDAAKKYSDAVGTDARQKVLEEVGPAVGAVLGSSRLVTLSKNLENIQKAVVASKDGKKPVFESMHGQTILRVQYYSIFQWLYDYLYSPLQATMFSLLAFYVGSAAFRAFRARTFEGTLLLVAAFLVMIGRVPFGYWLSQKIPIFDFPAIADWIMGTMNIAGQRAIMIGAALGVVSASLRMLLGLEQTYLGGD